MIVVKTFVSELHKKYSFLQEQINQFEEKVNVVNELIDLIKKTTLKDIKNINGEDLALLSESDFKKIIEVCNLDNACLEKFVDYAVTDNLYAKVLLDGNANEDLTKKAEEAKKWLDEQAKHIVEIITEFKNSNESYLNNLKQSDNLYKKYISYFDNEELIKPLNNIEEFNDVLKKSGLIMSEKWQLLKYIAKKNIDFKENLTESDLMEKIKQLLEQEKDLLEGINEEKINFCISLIDMPEEKVKQLNVSNEELIKYQKIPILNNIKLLYEETIELMNHEGNEKQIEKNKKELKAFKDSYDFFKNLT